MWTGITIIFKIFTNRYASEVRTIYLNLHFPRKQTFLGLVFFALPAMFKIYDKLGKIYIKTTPTCRIGAD